MWRAITILMAISALCCGPGTSTVHAQKGTGDATGIAQQSIQPEVVLLTGTIQKLKFGPCEDTTGRATVGTHVLIETAEGEELNIHLGPRAEVAQVARLLRAGKPISVRGFRTEKMTEHHYVAQMLQVGDKPIQLRDAALRPLWAGGRGAGSARSGQQQGAARGYGTGMSAGGTYGTCPAWGGPPAGRGRNGAAQAAGNGQGRGQAMGARRGGGRGQGMGQGGQQRGGQGNRNRRRSGR